MLIAMPISSTVGCRHSLGKTFCALCLAGYVSVAAVNAHQEEQPDYSWTIQAMQSSSTGSLDAQFVVQYHVDSVLEREVEALGSGFHSMQAAVPGELRWLLVPGLSADAGKTNVSSATSLAPPAAQST